MSNHNIAPQPVPSSPQQYQPQQPQPQPPQPQHLHTTICGIAAVVFGALGLVLSFIPIVNNIAAILGFIGVILAIIAIVGTFRGKKRGKVLSIVAGGVSGFHGGAVGVGHCDHAGHAVRCQQGH